MKYISVIILAVLIISCKQEAAKKETIVAASPKIENELTLTDDQLRTIEIDNISLEEKQISGTLQLNGKVDVDPDYRVSLSSALGGHIKSVRALPGKFVKKGEVILTVEDHQFIQIQQDYLTTQAQLLSAAPNYNRQKELNTSKSTSDKLMQQAETEYRTLLAVKNGLEQKLRLININPSNLAAGKIQRSINIVAPFNGMVSMVMVNKGKYVAASDELVELINPQGLLLELKVFEKDLGKIKAGQNLKIFTNANPDKKLNGKILTRGSSIKEDGSTEIIAKLTDPNAVELVNGLYINALVDVDRITAYTLPTDAIVSFDGKNYIFEQTDRNKYRLHVIETGNTVEGSTTILNFHALQGKKIVNKGAYALLMALKNKMEE